MALGDHNFADLKEFSLGAVTVPAAKEVADVTTTTTSNPEGSTLSSAPFSLQKEAEIGTHPAFTISHILNPVDSDPPIQPISNVDGSGVDHNSDHGTYNEEMMCVDSPLEWLKVNTDMSEETDSIPLCLAQENVVAIDDESTVKISTTPKTNSGLFGWLTGDSFRKRKKGTDSSGDESDSASFKTKNTLKKPKVTLGSSGPGQSRSATASRKLHQKLTSGEWRPTLNQAAEWKAKILLLDGQAEVNEKTTKDVRHSRCGRWIKMKEPCDTSRFQDHINKQCSKHPPAASAGMPSVAEWHRKFNIGFRNPNKPEPKHSGPCPGITESDHPRITTYLGRTGALGGGARSVTKIARQKFRKLFSRLSPKCKREVLDAQIQEHKWQNDHKNNRIFSSDCLQEISCPDGEDE